MPVVRCTFDLNDKMTSFLMCPGVGAMVVFSGQVSGRDNPTAVAKEDIGPIPPRTYYIVDRQSDGRLGFLYDLWSGLGFGTTDRTKWFALWNPRSGDSTIIDGIRRGHFRLHPMGPLGLSERCITVVDRHSFDKLAQYLRSQAPTLPVSGTTLMAYGTVEVR